MYKTGLIMFDLRKPGRLYSEYRCGSRPGIQGTPIDRLHGFDYGYSIDSIFDVISNQLACLLVVFWRSHLMDTPVSKK